MGNHKLLQAFLADLDEYTFQEFCREILTTPPDSGHRPGLDPYGQREEYGDRGQKQEGIDFSAVRQDGMRDVGQSKRYRSITAAEIATASTKFLEHWDSQWKGWRIKRFILLCACELRKTNLQQQIQKEAQRFAEKRVDYEAWGIERLATECEMRNDFSTRWFRKNPLIQPIVMQAEQRVTARFVPYREALASHVDRDLRELLEDWRKLPRREILAKIDSLIQESDRTGDSIRRAKAIRQKASLLLDMLPRNVAEARRLFESARKLDPAECEQTKRLEARLLEAEGHFGDAVALLSEGVDDDTRLLLASLYLENARRRPPFGDPSEREDMLKKTEGILSSLSTSTDVELQRLKAVLCLFRRGDNPPDLLGARSLLEQVSKKTRWWKVQFLQGVVEFFAAFSPQVTPDDPVEAPPFIPPGLLLTGSESKMHLRKAESIFRDLSSKEDSLVPSLMPRIWRLACLTYMDGAEEDAKLLSQSLVSGGEPAGIAILWAVGRKDEFDHDDIRKVLVQRIESGESEMQDLAALFSEGITPVGDPAGLNLLDSLHDRLSGSDPDRMNWMGPWWAAQRVRRLVAIGKPAEALQFIGQIDLPSGAKAELHLLVASQGNPKDLIQLIESNPECRNSRLYRYDYLSALGEEERWGAAIDVVRAFAAEPPTEEGVRLCIWTCRQAGRFDVLVEVVEKWGTACMDSQVRLRGLYAISLLNVGRIVDARREAKSTYQLASISPVDKKTALSDYVLILYRSGDLEEAVSKAKELGNLPLVGMAAQDVLFIATVLTADPQRSDKDLVGRLLNHAFQSGIPDEQVVEAYMVAQKVGAENFSRELVKRFGEIARRREDLGRMMSEEEGMAFLRQRVDYVHGMWEEYRFGQVPSHALCAAVNEPLPSLYHRVPSFAYSNLSCHRTQPTYVFHGRLSFDGQSRQVPLTARIRADITSLLLAYHLGILELIEKCFAPLRIAPETLEMLCSNRDQLQPVQPLRLSIMERILDASLLGKIRIITPGECRVAGERSSEPLDLGDFLRLAADQSASLLLGMPLQTGDSGDDLFATRSSVLTCLHRSGRIGQGEFEDAAKRLRTHEVNGQASGIPIETGASLLVDSIILQEFAAMPEVFDAFVSSFQVLSPHQEMRSVEGYIRDVRERQALAQWVDGLIRRVLSGLEAEEPRYWMLRSPEVAGEEETQVELRLIKHLLQGGEGEDEVFWTDDRYINGFANTEGKTNIVTLLDLLEAMRTRDQIQDADYYSVLLKLRGGNFQFVPLSSDEILYHLKKAPTENGSVVETKELRVLRRSLAASLSVPFSFQIRKNEDLERSEVNYVFSAMNAAIESMRKTAEAGGGDAESHFEWIGRMILIEHPLLASAFPQLATLASSRSLRAATIARLYTEGINIANSSRRKEYFSWVERHLTSYWTGIESEVRREIIHFLDGSIRGIISVDGKASAPRTVLAVLQRFVLDLPRDVAADLLRWGSVGGEVGVGFGKVVGVAGEMAFRVDDLAAACVIACEGRDSALRGVDSLEEFRPGIANGHLVLTSTSKKSIQLPFIPVRVMHREASVRRAALKEVVEDLDLPRADRGKFIGAVLANKQPSSRLECILEARERAANLRYSRLAESLLQRDSFEESDFQIPHLVNLARHMRLPTKGAKGLKWEAAWTKSVSTLLGELPISDAFMRLSLLPVPMPDVLVRALGSLKEDQRGAVLQSLCERSMSPLDRVHLTSVLLRLAQENYSATAKELLRQMLVPSEGEEHSPIIGALESFIALLGASERLVRLENATAEWPAHYLHAFSWAHAGELYRCFQGATLDMSRMSEGLRIQRNSVPLWPLRLEPFHGDVTQPMRLTPAYLLLRFLNYAVSPSPAVTKEVLTNGLLALGGNEVLEEVEISRFRDESTLSDHIQSFLADEPTRIWEIFGEEVASWMTAEVRRARLEKAVASICSGADDEEAFPAVVLSVGGGDSNPLATKAILHLAKGLQPVDEKSLHKFSRVCSYVRTLPQECRSALASSLEQRISSAAALPQVSVSLFVESALGIANSYPPKERAPAFVRVLSRVLDRNPKYASDLLPIVWNLWLLSPSADAPQLHALLVRLRATA